MGREIAIRVVLVLVAAALGNGDMFENSISPLSYHTCDYRVTKNVSKMVAFQMPYETMVPCPGWIPWKMCSKKTYYKTEYHSITVPETITIKRCCDGYEQVGSYCVLSLYNSSDSDFKSGVCRNITKEIPGNKCTFDLDCPVPQKCCNLSNGSFCVSPAPQALDRNTIKYWYNGTVTIKMGYNELIRVDPRFFNHTRLLHAMITGELWPLQTCIHHLFTKPAGSFSVQSQVLIGINQPSCLMSISTKLNSIVVRLPEVISIQIEDVNECLNPELNVCSHDESCVNLEGSYNCTNSMKPPNGGTDMPGSTSSPTHSSEPTHKWAPNSSSSLVPTMTPFCNCSILSNPSVINVTSSSFYVQWNTDCPENYSYTVQVHSMTGHNQSCGINQTHLNISGLAAGELYTVNVSFQDCRGRVQSWTQKVKTDAQILSVTLKITNYNMTENLQNSSSEEYGMFINSFIKEVKNSLSNDVDPNKVTVKIYSLTPGSINIHFSIIISDVNDTVNITGSSFTSANKSVFEIDQKSISVSAFNECLTALDNDCDVNADCNDLGVSYTCECRKSYIDTNPSRPGRSCQLQVTEMSPLPYTTPNISTAASEDPTSLPVPTIKSTSHLTTEVHKPEESSTTTQGMTSSQQIVVSSTSTLVDQTMSHISMNTTAEYSSHSTMEKSSTVLQVANVTHKPTTSISVTRENGHTIHNDVTNTTIIPNSTYSTTEHITNHSTTANTSTVSATYTMNTKETQTSSHMLGSTSDRSSHGTAAHPNSGSTNTPFTSHPNTTIHHSPKTPATTIKDESKFEMITERTTTTSNTISLKDASKLICGQEKIGITIQRTYLNQVSISASSLYLGNTSCNVSLSTDTYVQLQAGWTECGTNVQSNETHTVANTTLYADLPPAYSNVKQPLKPIKPLGFLRCVFLNNILSSAGYSPPEGVHFVIEDLQGDGNFSTEFALYDGDQPISKNFTLAATDDITVHIKIKTNDAQFKLVISDCWATPSTDAHDLMSYPFINNSCALKGTHTVIISNGISNNASFQTKIFAYVDTPVVYLHCRLRVCKETEQLICKPSCDGSRALRSGEQVSTSVTRIGPLHRADHPNKGQLSKSSALGPGYIALIIILIFVFVAGVAAILICWHERRTGKYSFKLKSRDVGYQVFSN